MMDILLFFHHPCVQRALLASFFASIIGGVVGTFVVVKRLSFISGSISHAVIAGVGLSLFLEKVFHLPSIPPIIGAFCAAAAFALVIAKAEKTFQEREDSVISLLFAGGMAFGIICLAKTPGYVTELNNILVGNIVWISRSDVIILAAVTVFCVAYIAARFQKFTLVCFDIDQAALSGINTERMYTSLLLLVAVTVVALTQIVGIVLVMTMLTIPQLFAGLFCRTIFSMCLCSCCISMGCAVCGLYLSYAWDIPPGASIALFSILVYGFGLFCTMMRRRIT